MARVDDICAGTLREKRIALALAAPEVPVRALAPVLLAVDYAGTLPDGLALPLVCEVHGPTEDSYSKHEFTRVQPVSLTFVPRRGGRHVIILREAAHHRWWGSLEVDVVGSDVEQPDRPLYYDKPIVLLTSPRAGAVLWVDEAAAWSATVDPVDGTATACKFELGSPPDVVGTGTPAGVDVWSASIVPLSEQRGERDAYAHAWTNRGMDDYSAAHSISVRRAVRSSLGCDLSGSTKYHGGAWGVDGKLYAAPYSAGNILIVDPVTMTATRSTMGATCSTTWMSQVAASNGMIYGVPYAATNILRIDPTAGTASNVTMGATLTGASKWHGAVEAGGKIWCVPWAAADCLVIDVAAETATRTNFGLTLTDATKWSCAAVADNGKVYCAPSSATDFLVITPSAGTAVRTTLGVTLPATGDKYRAIVKGLNGLLYCIPHSHTEICIIDPATDTATLTAMGADLAGTAKWHGGALLPGGAIVGMPWLATDVLVIHPTQGTAERSAVGADLSGTPRWSCLGEAWNDVLFGVPRDGTDLLVID